MIESGTPWIGNVTAETDGRAYWMSKENFLKILGGHNLASLIAKSGEQRFLVSGCRCCLCLTPHAMRPQNNLFFIALFAVYRWPFQSFPTRILIRVNWNSWENFFSTKARHLPDSYRSHHRHEETMLSWYQQGAA